MARLIAFNKNCHRVQFKGYSKLSIDYLSNNLYVEPVNEAFKLVSASFECQYVMKKNLLFVFGERNCNDFCLVFVNEQICKKVFGYIASKKKNTETSEELSIDNSFINPIFQAISNDLGINSDLIDAIATWHHLLDDEDKQRYTTLMKEYGIYDLIEAATPFQQKQIKVEHLNITGNRKRKSVKMEKEEPAEHMIECFQSDPDFVSSPRFELIFDLQTRRRSLLIFLSDENENFLEFKLYGNPQNDEFKCVSCDHKGKIDINQSGELCVKLESKNHPCQPSTTIPENFKKLQLIEKPEYEILENSADESKNVLIIFDSDDQNYCYEYKWNSSHSKFFCRGCRHMKIDFSATSKAKIYHLGTPKEYAEFSSHQCQKRKYAPKKYQQVYERVFKPKFEIQKVLKKGKECQELLIFHQNDRSKCHRYLSHLSIKKFQCLECYKMGKYVSAKLRQNREDEEYIILSPTKHVCQMKPYILNDKIILHPPEFELSKEMRTGIQKVFVADKNDKKKCHVFNKEGDLYACLGCQMGGEKGKKRKRSNVGTKKVTGKLIKNESGEYSFAMNANQTHICKPRPHQFSTAPTVMTTPKNNAKPAEKLSSESRATPETNAKSAEELSSETRVLPSSPVPDDFDVVDASADDFDFVNASPANFDVGDASLDDFDAVDASAENPPLMPEISDEMLDQMFRERFPERIVGNPNLVQSAESSQNPNSNGFFITQAQLTATIAAAIQAVHQTPMIQAARQPHETPVNRTIRQPQNIDPMHRQLLRHPYTSAQDAMLVERFAHLQLRYPDASYRHISERVWDIENFGRTRRNLYQHILRQLLSRCQARVEVLEKATEENRVVHVMPGLLLPPEDAPQNPEETMQEDVEAASGADEDA